MEDNNLIRSDCRFMTLEGLRKVPKTCDHIICLFVGGEIEHRLVFVWQPPLHYHSDVLLGLGCTPFLTVMTLELPWYA